MRLGSSALLATASCLAMLAGSALAQAPAPAVSDREVSALIAALEQGKVDGLREVVGERVLLARMNDFEKKGADAMIAALRGCRHFETQRVPGNEAVFLDIVCAGAPRTGLREEEDPGYSLRLWRHPAGVLAVSYYATGIQVRPRSHPPRPPAPPRPPEPRN